MKVIQSSLFRAVCSMAVGALLIKYREEMVVWMVIAIGVLFLLSGIVSCVVYYAQRKRYLREQLDNVRLFDSDGNEIAPKSPTFPIVGIGSVLLGLILSAMPGTFIAWLVYILAAIIVLCALNQFFALASARHYGRVGWGYWVMPVLLLLGAIVAIVNPQFIASAPFFFIGWCILISGVVDCINAIKVHSVRRAASKADAVEEAQGETEMLPETTDEANS